MDYTAKHEQALIKMKERGAPASFRLESPGTHDETTDRFTAPTVTVVNGYAAEIVQERDEYMTEYIREELIRAGSSLLVFVPNIIGELPPLGSVVEWAGDQYTVNGFRPIRPAGVVIAAKVAIA